MAKLKTGAKKSIHILMMIIAPLMLGLVVVARPLVILLLTEKWLPCVPYLQILCIAGIFYPLHSINLSILLAIGRSDLFFRLEVIKQIAVVFAIAVTYRWGVLAMIWGQLVVNIIGCYINSYYSGKLINYKFKEQVFDTTPYVGIATLMVAAIYCLKYAVPSNDMILLVFQVTAGFIIYTLLNFVFKTSGFVEVITILRSQLNRPTLKEQADGKPSSQHFNGNLQSRTIHCASD